MNGFSPVTITRLGSATGILISLMEPPGHWRVVLEGAPHSAAGGASLSRSNSMGQSFRVAIGAASSIAAFASSAFALNDPPSQAGRLAYTEGTVSFHDDQQAGWSPAVDQYATYLGRFDLDRTQCPQRGLGRGNARAHGRQHAAQPAGDRRQPDPPAGRPGPRRHQDIRAQSQHALSDRDAARHGRPAPAGRLLRRGGLHPGRDAAGRPRRRGADPEPRRPEPRRSTQARWPRYSATPARCSCAPSTPRRRCSRPRGPRAIARSTTIRRRNICRPASPATRISTATAAGATTASTATSGRRAPCRLAGSPTSKVTGRM